MVFVPPPIFTFFSVLSSVLGAPCQVHLVRSPGSVYWSYTVCSTCSARYRSWIMFIRLFSSNLMKRICDIRTLFVFVPMSVSLSLYLLCPNFAFRKKIGYSSHDDPCSWFTCISQSSWLSQLLFPPPTIYAPVFSCSKWFFEEYAIFRSPLSEVFSYILSHRRSFYEDQSEVLIVSLPIPFFLLIFMGGFLIDDLFYSFPVEEEKESCSWQYCWRILLVSSSVEFLRRLPVPS